MKSAARTKAAAELYENALGLSYPLDSVLVTTGSRPGVYGTYRTLVGEGEGVSYGVPSWNNNYYTHMMGAEPLVVECGPADAFLPTRERLEPLVRRARLLALNSPLNPTGTAFSAESLGAICDLVLEESGRSYKLSWEDGQVVAAESPSPADSALVPACVVRFYGRPQHRTFREDSPAAAD